MEPGHAAHAAIVGIACKPHAFNNTFKNNDL